MSKLNELIDKQIHDIQFNGCSLPESILRKQFEVIVSLAKLEESMEANQRYLDSIGTAFGNGANDQFDKHKGFIIGEVYKHKRTKELCYFCGVNNLDNHVFELIDGNGSTSIPLPPNFISKGNNTFYSYERIEKNYEPTLIITPDVIGQHITEPTDLNFIDPATN